jgi:hypothetical protein
MAAQSQLQDLRAISSRLRGECGVPVERGDGLSAESWRALIVAAAGQRSVPVGARSYLQGWKTNARPVLVRCDDDHEYVVKGRQVGRALVADQVVGYLGGVIAAPVPPVVLVDVPAELIQAEPAMAHMSPGVGHGCRWMPGCIDSVHIANAGRPWNRPRFALLAILYGLARADDRQMIYAMDGSGLVHSVDHGHFLPDGPEWTIQALRAYPTAVPDRIIVQECQLRPEELEAAGAALSTVTDEALATAVAGPPDEWGVSLDERVELAYYLAKRRDELLTSLDR